MRKLTLAPAALLVCAGALAAQTTFVSPARSATIDAYSSTSYRSASRASRPRAT
ncbi:MAG: hypothetical protein R3F30_08495 [Planctomycetota bacterium]